LRRARLAALVLLAGLFGACAESPRGTPGPDQAPRAPTDSVTAAPFIGPTWWLVAHQSMDDAIGTRRPAAPYSLRFESDGSLFLRAHCNRGQGRWLYDAPSGLRLGPLALTRAACPPGSLYDRIVSDLEYVRSFVLRDGGLFLATLADGAILEFRPRTQPAFDCEQAEGQVEVLICTDPDLAARDRELDALFQRVLQRIPAAQRADLRAQQRGWIKGRNDCWKSEAVAACVAEEYARRVSALALCLSDEVSARSRATQAGPPLLLSCRRELAALVRAVRG